MNTRRTPPRAAERLLAALLPDEIRESFLTDLADAFNSPANRRSAFWYWGQTARAIWPPTLITLHRHQQFDEGRMMPETASLLEIVLYDSRLALRGFRRRPFFTAMIVT